MTQEYWRWPESRWTAGDVDWKKAGLITLGVDVGAVSSQAAVMCDDKLYCYANMRTGPESAASARNVTDKALEGTGLKLKDIARTVATGIGRKNVAFAQQATNEIECHLRGARFMYGPSLRTLVDMGGEGTRAMKCTEYGRLTEFFVNDKCASGMGRGVELVSRLMHVPITEMGPLSLTAGEQDPEPVTTTCYLFANTEALGMYREGKKDNEVLSAYLFGVAYRIFTLVGRMKMEKDLAFTGGVAKNVGVVKRLERELGVTALTSKYDTQLAGAIGAALFAQDLAAKPAKKAAVAAK